MKTDPRCQEAHAKTISGTCPWCQHAVIYGKPNGPRAKPAATFRKPRHHSELRRLIREKLLAKLDASKLGDLDRDTLRRELRLALQRICDAVDAGLLPRQQARLIDEILNEMFPS